METSGKNIDDGGPAFPNVPDGAGTRWDLWDTGISMRDYFAAKAMQAFITGFNANGEGHNWTYRDFAKEAYIVADEMLLARKL